MTRGARLASLAGSLALAALLPACGASAARGAHRRVPREVAAVQPAGRRGILPPEVPSRSLPPNPRFSYARVCEAREDSLACNRIVFEAIDRGRRVLEGLTPLSFSLRAYARLRPAEQLFVLVNLERTSRGLPPVLELISSLDSVATRAVLHNENPAASAVPRRYPGGATLHASGSAWASGFDNPAGADYTWMYNDGYEAPLVNLDCPKPSAGGCWDHRATMLYTYVTKASCTGRPATTVMGAAYIATGAVEGDGEVDVFAGVCGPLPTGAVLTWKTAERLLKIAHSS